MDIGLIKRIDVIKIKPRIKDSVRGIHNVWCRAVIGIQRVQTMFLGQIQHDIFGFEVGVNVRATEGVNGLLWITNQIAIGLIFHGLFIEVDRTKDIELDRICVLELINHGQWITGTDRPSQTFTQSASRVQSKIQTTQHIICAHHMLILADPINLIVKHNRDEGTKQITHRS